MGGLAYALLVPDTYEYVSLVQVAQKDWNEPIQATSVTVATLENRWLPEEKTIYRTRNDEKLPFDVQFKNPENTALIRFSSESSQQGASQVKEVHASLIESLQQYQQSLVKREKVSIERQIKAAGTVIEALKGQPESGEPLAAAIQRLAYLEGGLENLTGVEVLVSARQRTEKIGPKRSLIMVLAVLLGLMLGVFMAFMVEFGVSVKKTVNQR